jgi:hypothetical protein
VVTNVKTSHGKKSKQKCIQDLLILHPENVYLAVKDINDEHKAA